MRAALIVMAMLVVLPVNAKDIPSTHRYYHLHHGVRHWYTKIIRQTIRKTIIIEKNMQTHKAPINTTPITPLH